MARAAALHKDSGHVRKGVGELSAVECGDYEDGYTILPEHEAGCATLYTSTCDGGRMRRDNDMRTRRAQ
eukprot:9487862-Pyramimonas_sp.AAC.1